jgi:predicted N-acetyltransferase YhbS
MSDSSSSLWIELARHGLNRETALPAGAPTGTLGELVAANNVTTLDALAQLAHELGLQVPQIERLQRPPVEAASDADVAALVLVDLAEPLAANEPALLAAFGSAVAGESDAEAAFDAKMRALLCECFPHEAKFVTQRFNNDMPNRRFVLRTPQGDLACHVAVHHKSLALPGGAVERYVGIAEVATAERFRKRGLVKRLLALVHKQYAALGYDWSILMAGSSAYYMSSGYRSVRNIQAFDVDPYKQFHHPMVLSLADPPRAWHTDEKVVLNSKYF